MMVALLHAGCGWGGALAGGDAAAGGVVEVLLMLAEAGAAGAGLLASGACRLASSGGAASSGSASPGWSGSTGEEGRALGPGTEEELLLLAMALEAGNEAPSSSAVSVVPVPAVNCTSVGKLPLAPDLMTCLQACSQEGRAGKKKLGQGGGSRSQARQAALVAAPVNFVCLPFHTKLERAGGSLWHLCVAIAPCTSHNQRASPSHC